MPVLRTPDWWQEITTCKWFCNTKWQGHLSCWIWCRNKKHLIEEEKKEINRLETILYNTVILEHREYYKQKIKAMINPNFRNWEKLKVREKDL